MREKRNADQCQHTTPVRMAGCDRKGCQQQLKDVNQLVGQSSGVLEQDGAELMSSGWGEQVDNPNFVLI